MEAPWWTRLALAGRMRTRLVKPVVDEREAAIIRDLAKAVLDEGRSAWSLAKGLNESGARTVRATRWDVTSIKNLLIRERNYGQGDDQGRRHRAGAGREHQLAPDSG